MAWRSMPKIRKQIRDIEKAKCPTCGREGAGTCCLNPNGTIRQIPHPERIRKAGKPK